MGAVLRIEDDDVVRMAEELAALHHVSLRDAVADALRRHIAWERDVAKRQARIEEIARNVRAHLTEPLPSSDHAWLYDENGLPA